ncbi:MAG: hypothetical protein JWP44_2413 [Mucilaginibacter sp.]|nr:hypothetical protein [Mucilaginibacter sp.]
MITETWFVNKNSIVRKIWGNADTALFIFAGAAAEFALNKAVDWLYFTGRLPADPLGRLFSTVAYARQIIFSEEAAALSAIDKITAIHKGVEENRGAKIPDWAYRDVLFLLIDYSIRSFELLERKLIEAEKAEVFDVFYRVGCRMHLAGLPAGFGEWQEMRKTHLETDLVKSRCTIDLYKQYKKHLGLVRYVILKQIQLMLAPGAVRNLLPLGNIRWINPFLKIYKLFRIIKLEGFLKSALLPSAYKTQIKELSIS